jgi:DnaD/phage-associated family protein
MNGFSGFPDGKHTLIMIPGQFFSDLLPIIDHLVELKVTLYCFWVLNAQEGIYRYIRLSEVYKDSVFMDSLGGKHEERNTLLRDGFERAVARGTLLCVKVRLPAGEEDIYFLNSERGRAAMAALKRGEWQPDPDMRPIALIAERPPIYSIYEQNIGVLTPMIADQLRDLEKEYSHDWLWDAIQIAAIRHVTNLNYIIGILRRWEKEGRNTERRAKGAMSDEQYAQYLKSQYPDLFED